MESRGNDERIEFVGPTISVRWREKTCGPRIYVNDHITLNFSNYLHPTFLEFMQPNRPLNNHRFLSHITNGPENRVHRWQISTFAKKKKEN